MSEISHAAVLGAGVIGASWAALFLASGRSIAVFDPDPDAEDRVRSYIDRAWPALDELGLAERGDPGRISFHADAADAVRNAGFVQENAPERVAIKHRLIAEAEAALDRDAIFSSSTSGLTWEEIAKGFRDPSRLVLGHPFNPPHLIPLVEMTAGSETDENAMTRARAFYEDAEKVVIRLRKGMPGHVANRLQAAVWREAIHLVVEDVASVEDVDKAIWAGPGLRWATMGPTMLFHLGAGEGGLRAYCDHFRDTFNGWWKGLGEVWLTDKVVEKIANGVAEEAGGRTPEELSARRDEMIVALRKTLGGFEPR